MTALSRRDLVYLILTGLFVTNAVIAELIGGKLIEVTIPFLGNRIMSIGVVPWPIVFLTTDLINEYFGKDGVRRITFMTVGLIIYAFVILFAAMAIPASPVSAVSDENFNAVFGQSQWIIVGSIVAFMASQLVDVVVFWFFRKRTGGKMLWLRATGSTAVSQLIDSFVIIFIAFYFSGKLSFSEAFNLSITNYSYKLIIAVALTPLIYGSHSIIDRFLGAEASQHQMKSAERHS